jgi:hypothetical protein
MTQYETAQGAPEVRGKSGLALAGAGLVLAVLAFLGGTAVGHAWGTGSAGNEQTQFGGPGGGGMRQFPGNQQQQPPGQTRTS